MNRLVRVATWNINFRGPKVCHSLGQLAGERDVDVVLLQEANPNSLDQFVSAAGLDWVITAFTAGAPYPSATGRRRVTAIAGRGQAPIESGVLTELPLPERMVFARLTTEAGPLTVASYHAPPGASWGIVKVHHAHALRQWINEVSGPIVVGADANTPDVDHPDPESVRTHWPTGARRLAGIEGDDITFGGRPQHRLHDALRVWLDQHPAELERLAGSRPSGPLAISHHTGRRRDSAGAPRRYDALWLSPDLTPTSVTYDYKASVEAGSDHALVTANLLPSPLAPFTSGGGPKG